MLVMITGDMAFYSFVAMLAVLVSSSETQDNTDAVPSIYHSSHSPDPPTDDPLLPINLVMVPYLPDHGSTNATDSDTVLLRELRLNVIVRITKQTLQLATVARFQTHTFASIDRITRLIAAWFRSWYNFIYLC